MSAAFRTGDRVEYGTSSPLGGDRLGEVLRLARRYRQDCALIVPLSVTPGDGTLPDWYPLHMVQPWQPGRWACDPVTGNWRRTYAEIRRSAPGRRSQ